MEKKAASAITLTLLLMSMLMMAFNIQSVKAEGTIYIRADGSIDPPTAPISTLDNVTYTLTGDISDPVVIERSSIVVEGAGQRVMGIGAEGSIGMYLSGSSNVTLVNMEITGFSYGIRLYYSSNNTIASSNVTASGRVGIDLYYSSNNSMLGNNVAGNVYGISLEVSSNNRIHGNIFTNDGLCVRMSYANSVENNTVNGRPLVYLEDVSDYNVQEAGQVILVRCHNIMVDGLSISETDIGIQLLETNSSIIAENKLANNLVSMYLWVSLNNTISGNNISDNFVGIWLYFSSNTRIFHNNFNNNTQQTKIDPDGYNAWDDGYPSGGNYWSDYAGVDANGDGIGDTPYVIDAGNQDRYPLMHLWSPLPVHNINTGLGYATIQEAIDAPETLDGHTVFVGLGTYYENVFLYKSLTLKGEDPETTIIDGGGSGHVIHVTTNNVMIGGFTFQNGFGGISLDRSSGDTITNNLITLNSMSGIEHYHSNNNIIRDNNVTLNSLAGIWLWNSSNNIVSRNYVSSNTWQGIVMSTSSNYNQVSENAVIDTQIEGGIVIVESFHNTVSNNVVIDNGGDGIPLVFSDYNRVKENQVTANSGHGILSVSSMGNVISYNNASHNGLTGIALVDSSNGNRLEGNTVTSNTVDGISLVDSSNGNAIEANEAVNNGNGIHLDNSTDNSVSYNNATLNVYCGIQLVHSENSNVKKNVVTLNSIGIMLHASEHNVIEDNKVTHNGEGILLAFSNRNIVEANEAVENGGNGIRLYNSSYNEVSHNNASIDDTGIVLETSSNNNTLVGNNVASNYNGILVGYSSNNNTIYHNNFLHNTVQVVHITSGCVNVWDNGYPSGGNYWSDYNGTDLYSGPYQNETSSDGMGDTPYVIDADNQDRYPLMRPWNSFVLYGDVNGDGTVNILDVILVSKAFGTSEGDSNYDSPSDLNQDGRINILDTILVARHFGQHIP